MSEITLNVIVILGTLIFVVLVFWWTRRRKASQDEALRQVAAERGWQFVTIREPLAWGFRMTGPGWVFESLSRSAPVESGPGSSNIAETTCWQAESPGSPLLIGPNLSPVDHPLAHQLARQVITNEMGEAAGGLREMAAGSSELRRRYSLWVSDQAELEQLLGPAVESILIHWKGKPPVIKRANGILKIEIQGVRYTKADDIARVVHLGEALLSPD